MNKGEKNSLGERGKERGWRKKIRGSEKEGMNRGRRGRW